MRIKRIACEQFAGLTGKALELEQGLNLVIGENESGKSTLIDLIYLLLFKDVRLDGRKDVDFIDQYFPKKVSGPQGDFIDGALVFETPSGTFQLKKEWEKGTGSCRLTVPDGTSIKGNDKINEILKEELKYRAGVYGEIVFASRKRDQAAVESIMRALGKKADALSDTREDLTSTLERAALETGGVSLDLMEKAIKEQMNALIGRWDWNADAPEGGPKRATYRNPWLKEAGEIVKAYYELDEVRSRQADALKAEQAAEEEREQIKVLQGRKKEAETKWHTFQQYRGLLGQLSYLERSIQETEEKIREQAAAYQRWPGLSSDIAKARELQTKRRQAQIHDLYLKAEPARRSCLQIQAELEKYRAVDAADLKLAEELIRSRQREESRLAGMNVAVKIREPWPAELTVTSAVSGKALEPAGGEIQITEAADIRIPGILDMQLMPMGVDVETVRQKLASIESDLQSIYRKYGAGSVEELQTMSASYTAAEQEAEKRNMHLERILGESSWEEIKAANDSVPAGIETESEILRQIADLCGHRTVDAMIGGLESTLADYEGRYGSPDELKASMEKLKEKKDKEKKQLESMEEIPEEYRGIDDPDQYDADLRKESEDFESQIQTHSERLRAAERNLGEKTAEEYSDDLQEKEAVLGERKAEYGHWKNIYGVFCRLKEQSKDNPVEDIETRFRAYLEEITDGSLQLHAMDEQMSVQLASGPSALTYDILSDGTKDTVSLAFRLAMLEHLYPEGGGLAVFDDPFTDMDPKRVRQSCSLIERFARNNQVIFVTCDDKYRNYLSGNVISVVRS